jgi:hypothetical protein
LRTYGWPRELKLLFKNTFEDLKTLSLEHLPKPRKLPTKASKCIHVQKYRERIKSSMKIKH